MRARRTRKGALHTWRLRLQTSGIYAILPSQVGKSKPAGRLAPPAPWSGPGVGARVASLRCPILRPGQPQ